MNKRRQARSQLPAFEDDQCQEVVIRLLRQHGVDEEKARNPLRLLEELAFHDRFCGWSLIRGFAEELASWMVKTEGFDRVAPMETAQQWLTDLEQWQLLARNWNGTETVYGFTIPKLREYFAARHLAARWNDPTYRDWLPCTDRWWERSAEFLCPNPYCSVALPPFREFLDRTTYEETLLLLVGVLQDEDREEQFLAGMCGDPNLMLKALARCRHSHETVMQALELNEALWDPSEWDYLKEGWAAIGSARVEAVRQGIVTGLNEFLYCYGAADLLHCFAVDALVKIGDPRGLEELIADLNSAVPGNRIWAAERLGEMRMEEAVESLISTLCEPVAGVRARMERAMDEARDDLGLGHRMDELDDIIYEVRSTVADALVQIGRAAVEPLIDALRDADPDVRHYAADALGRIGDARAVEPLVAALRDADPDVRLHAAEALRRIKNRRSVAALINQLHNTDWLVRSKAAQALDELGRDLEQHVRQWAVRAVTDLCDQNAEVRLWAAWALGAVRDEQAVPQLAVALRDPSHAVRVVANYALERIGRAAVDTLAAALRDSDAGVRFRAAWALEQIGDGLAVEPLMAALRDANPGVRSQAADTLDSYFAVHDSGLSLVPVSGALRDSLPGCLDPAARRPGAG